MTQLANLMVQRFSRSTTEVAQNCIDSSNPELYLNLPTGDGSFRDVRYQNTCGNRFCMQRLGFESGRVIEIGPNGDTTLECRHSTPPQTGNACAGIVVQSPLIVTQQTSVTEVAGECIDSAVPTLELNMPGVYPARFVDTCGKRFCQNHGFREGRVVEMADNIAIAECYREPSSLFADATVNVEDVARQCIDDVVRTLADNMPEHNQLRFMSTCGDRYCRQVLGHVSGQVVEYNNGVAQLTCVRTH